MTIVELDGPRAVFDLAAGADDQDVLRAALSRGPVRAFAPVRPLARRDLPGGDPR